ncbi:uncharacterized protein BCR38DRAFT_440808 [Pseudomassariella vexata]|uniref:F-box domain-containing protein n=1 Tax=Pseudomassariella vexata TaxID=1141098 RepID=A0A1Y2DQU2_9PEZI|nr:uncharacterized protein BCR38DRAFT_440808 [Pseudomassariella vexata]ORY61651.1 hypothetical protein BCR38DRAFT_440808 [Pseudomassariella vexata]
MELEHPGQRFRLFDLPVEIQIRILGLLENSNLDLITSNFRQAASVLRDHFPSFVQLAFDGFPGMSNNQEIRHIIYRIIKVSRTLRPFERGPMAFVRWIRKFQARSDDTPLPALPRTVQTLNSLDQIIDSIEFWMIRFHHSLTIVYGGNLCDITLAVLQNTSWENEYSFTSVENYRIRRALLLFQLYCVLFHQPADHRDHSFNGRVAEQALFLQSLQPFMIAELDGVYGMIEWILASHFRISWHISRRSTAMVPGSQSRPGGAKLEHVMSRGLLELRQLILHTPKLTGDPRPYDERWNKIAGKMQAFQNRFFMTALGKCWKFQSDNAGTNYKVVSYPSKVPISMRRWNGAPEGTNDGSWAYTMTYTKPSGSDSEAREIAALERAVNGDQFNWRGLVFWERERLKRHDSRINFDPVVMANFRGQDPGNGPPNAWVERLKATDPPNVGYQPRLRPLSTAMFSQYTLLSGAQHLTRLYGMFSAEEMVRYRSAMTSGISMDL